MVKLLQNGLITFFVLSFLNGSSNQYEIKYSASMLGGISKISDEVRYGYNHGFSI